MSCCPPGSLGQLGESGYTPKGRTQRVDDLDIYIVGEGEKVVIWNYDIFGIDGGRTKQIADIIAEAGFLVMIPDYFRGTYQDPTTPGVMEFLKKNTNWNNLKQDWNNKILPTAKSLGGSVFGAVGTCWGSYVVVRLSGLDELKCGISIHPSHTKITAFLGEDERVLLNQIKCPQLFLPAGNDTPETKVGGLAEQVLADRIQIEEFPEMNHGWSTRGDIGQPNVERDAKKAVQLTLDFLNKYM